MAPSKTMCMKAKKLCVLYKLILSTNKMAIRNGMYIGGKILWSILFTVREKNQIRFELPSGVFQLFDEM